MTEQDADTDTDEDEDVVVINEGKQLHEITDAIAPLLAADAHHIPQPQPQSKLQPQSETQTPHTA